MVTANQLMTIAASLCIVYAEPASGAAEQATQPALAPQLCEQLGGPLPCQKAQPGPWIYKVGDATFTSEATAYGHMLDTHGPGSIFALVYRWGKVNPNPGPPEQVRSIETMSWKMYFRECSGSSDAPCDEFPRFTGYQRLRDVACPQGHVFSSDASSPYCLPGDAARAVAETIGSTSGRLAIGTPQRSAQPH